jgi:uncharacterized protein YacL
MVHAPVSVNVARAVFALISCVVGITIALGLEGQAWLGAVAGTGFALAVILLESALRGFSIRGFSAGTFGLMVGLFCAWLITRSGVIGQALPDSFEQRTEVEKVLQLCLYGGLGFIGAALALRSNTEEFSFVIPYVRFRRESIEEQPLLVDTNIIIDGRLPRVAESGFISGSLVIPRFVVDELHLLADSPDAVKRERGKRGLDCLNELQSSEVLHVAVHEDFVPGEKMVDAKLVGLAKQLGARVLTNDANLGKVARLRGVPVLNLNDLARAMRPVVASGDELELSLIKEGKDQHQAVGYLADGTMIVVNHASSRLGETVPIVVTSTLQTSAGRLIFAELKENAPNGGGRGEPRHGGARQGG